MRHKRFAKFMGIDPLRLISSGCMIITCKNGRELVKELENNGIEAAVIGKITADWVENLFVKTIKLLTFRAGFG